MYDASLDAYLPHNWASGFGVFRIDHSNLSSQFENQLKNLQYIYSTWRLDQRNGSLTYRSFPPEIIGNFYGYQYRRNRNGAMAPDSAFGGRELAKGMAMDAVEKQSLRKKADGKPGDVGGADEAPGPDLSKVSARKNLNETAFFFPHLPGERRRRREVGIHDARSADRMEVPRLRPRQPTARWAADRQSRHGQGPDGATQSAALRPRGRRVGVHGQSQQPVADPSDRQGAA